MSGWIKLQRDIMDHWIAQDAEYLSVWIRMLSEANFEPRTLMFNGQVITVGRGQLIFGLKTYAEKTKMTEMRLRTLVSLLEKHQMINRVKNSKYSLISIVNYDKYQADNRQTTGSEQADNKQTTGRQQADNNTIRSKELKEVNNDNNHSVAALHFSQPSKQAVWRYMFELGKGSELEAEKFVDFYQSKGWLVGKVKMKDWKAAVRNWTKSQQQFKQVGTVDQIAQAAMEFLNDRT